MKKTLIGYLFVSSLAWGHARIASNSDITPRNDNPGLKSGPCGNVLRTSTPKQLQGGQTVTFKWEETINHPGNYFIEFSQANDSGWVRLQTVPDVKNTTDDLPHQYSMSITIPNVSCDACTVRLVQEMTDRDPPTYYYSCADVKVTAVSTQPPADPPVDDDTTSDDYNEPSTEPASDDSCH